MFPKSLNMKRDDEAETEIRIDFEPTFKCEITGSENKTLHIRNTFYLFISLKGLNFSFQIPMVITITKTPFT